MNDPTFTGILTLYRHPDAAAMIEVQLTREEAINALVDLNQRDRAEAEALTDEELSDLLHDVLTSGSGQP